MREFVMAYLIVGAGWMLATACFVGPHIQRQMRNVDRSMLLMIFLAGVLLWPIVIYRALTK